MNVGLFIFFIILCFKATKLIRENLGIFAAIIFVIGLLSFISNSGKNNAPNNNAKDETRKWRFYPGDSIAPNMSKFTSKVIDENLGFKLNIGVVFSEHLSTGNIVPAKASSFMTGFVIGYNWNPTVISIIPTTIKGQYVYDVNGVFEWKLLGLTLYSHIKRFSGAIN